jgi:hypothetical protein
MSHLSVEFVKKSCAFVLRIELPLSTMRGIMEFFADRKIYVESMQMQMIEGGEARLCIYCLVEKDRVNHTKAALEKMRGVVELQLLETRESNLVKNER